VFPKFNESIINTTEAGITQAQAARALQLVVWEIANENFGQFGYSLSNGYVIINSPSVSNISRRQADAWLAALSGAVTGGWTKLNNIFSIINQKIPGQDFVVQVVPIRRRLGCSAPACSGCSASRGGGRSRPDLIANG